MRTIRVVTLAALAVPACFNAISTSTATADTTVPAAPTSAAPTPMPPTTVPAAPDSPIATALRWADSLPQTMRWVTDDQAIAALTTTSEGATVAGELGLRVLPSTLVGVTQADVRWSAAFSGDGPPLTALQLDPAAIGRLTSALTAAGHVDGRVEQLELHPSMRAALSAEPNLRLLAARRPLSARLPIGWRYVAVSETGLVLASADDATIGRALQPSAARPAERRGVTSDTVQVVTLADPCVQLTADKLVPRRRAGDTVAPAPTAPPGGAQVHAYRRLDLATSASGQARIVFEYGEAATATTDLPLRTTMLRDGFSLATGQPLGDLLRVQGSHVEGTSIVIEVDLGKRLGLLDQMATALDLSWAVCPATP